MDNRILLPYRLAVSAAVLALTLTATTAFSPAFLSRQLSSRSPLVHVPSSPTSLYMGMNRKARRDAQRKQGTNRPESFYDAIKESDKMKDREEEAPVGTKAEDEKPVRTALEEELAGERVTSELGGEGESVVSGASIADAAPVGDERPDVSEVVMDDETGILRVVQGKNVKDVVTGKAIQLSSKGPEARMAQMFPGATPEVRDAHRFDWKAANVPDMVDALREALVVPVKDDKTGEEVMKIPPHPSVSDKGIDFVLANRDFLGYRMNKCLGRLKLRTQSQSKKEEALALRRLWKNFRTIENHVSAPFRQMLLDAEKNVGPNFGNLDLTSYCAGELYERTASYLVLKGMVAHWEKKVKDAEYVESTPETNENFLEILMVGDPRRYLPDPPIIYRLEECLSVCLMSRNMTQVFVSTPELYDDLPSEVRFVEEALKIKSGTELRRYVIEDFCPREEITPEGLREGVRRLHQQLWNMQIDPYGDLTNVVGRLMEAMAVGTDDALDPYQPYLSNMENSYDNPGFFQTYTTDHDKLSLVSFLDYPMKEINEGKIQSSDLAKQLGRDVQRLGLGFAESAANVGVEEDLSGGQAEEVYVPYDTPKSRAAGRPHNLGWLDILGDEELTGGEEVSGSKGGDDDNDFESDNWREKIAKKQGIRS